MKSFIKAFFISIVFFGNNYSMIKNYSEKKFLELYRKMVSQCVNPINLNSRTKLSKEVYSEIVTKLYNNFSERFATPGSKREPFKIKCSYLEDRINELKSFVVRKGLEILNENINKYRRICDENGVLGIDLTVRLKDGDLIFFYSRLEDKIKFLKVGYKQ